MHIKILKIELASPSMMAIEACLGIKSFKAGHDVLMMHNLKYLPSMMEDWRLTCV